ncbi:hemolysin family protein [Flavobacterium sp. F-65]|uniref:Hemolysin family protein n=1 Tax=Flavobacterium pisciphilum TaxID=2893755 RepID=A0ABS8MXG7_9FLAO|nr:hemolysin family protein [Flavobacterium sp. F-65]MCC9073480.1 hemolysin family protein [Flavobacterium sp. F-65]
MIDIFITLFLVFLNGFFVAAEFAIVKVRLSQVELQAKLGNKSAILSKHILHNLNGYLAATQLGITLASLGLGWVGEPVVSKLILKFVDLIGLELKPEYAHKIAIPLAFAVITVLHIVFGELAPKSIAIQKSEKTTLFIAYPLQFFYILFKPFIWLLNGIANAILKIFGIDASHGSEAHSSDELKYLVKQGKEDGVIEEMDYDIINNAFDFSERTVKQIIVSRTNVISVDIDNFDDSELDRVIDQGFSRIPCYETNIDNIIGVVYLKDLLLKAKKNQPIVIKEMMRPVLFVPSSRKIGSLLKEFQLKHIQLAVVVNEYGGTQGIVTLEDIIEELVGEIQDETDDEVANVIKKEINIYEVLASTHLNDINDDLPHPIKNDGENETLAGVLNSKFGRIPDVKDKITFNDYEFTILKKTKHSIILVQLRDLTKTK